MTRKLELLIGTEQELKLRRHFIHDPKGDFLFGLAMEGYTDHQEEAEYVRTEWIRRSANHLEAHYPGARITLLTGTPNNEDLIYDQAHYRLSTPTAEDTAELQKTYNEKRQA